MRGKSNTEVSKTKLERLDSYLVLGKVSPNSSLQCSNISLTTIAPLEGKEIFMTNLCSLLALQIRLSRSNISWKDSALGFLFTWVVRVASISQWSLLKNLCGVAIACTTSMFL